MTFENLPGHMMSGELMVDGKTADDKLAQVIVYMIWMLSLFVVKYSI